MLPLNLGVTGSRVPEGAYCSYMLGSKPGALQMVRSPQNVCVSLASSQEKPPVIVKFCVTANSKSDSRPLILACPALVMMVREFCPRYENWKFDQSSLKIAPLKRKRLSNHVVFQPIS